ncbi:MAG: tRNA pseudouridine(54/55) synthase Pus10 [Candidatus ainarchaeum sp.]|nr:tRNA pseudouridine(54/55) synthase Pus10 [Candidatus ainarchaeum sp.]
MGKRLERSNFFKILDFDYEKDFSIEKKENLIHNLANFFENFLNELEFDSFEIGFSWPSSFDISIEFKYSVRDRIIELLFEKFGKLHKVEDQDAYFLVDLSKSMVFVYSQPVYVQGNYCKYSRDLAQTEHFCMFCKGNGCSKCSNTGHITPNSVEQSLAKIIVPIFGAKQLILHGAGREDADVLMLGKGRPFVAEIVCPIKRKIVLGDVEKIVNDSCKDVFVNSLKFVLKKDVALVKNAIHEKIYCAIINCSKKINFDKIVFNKKIVIEQLTPTRVEKRRALLKREKEITFLEYKKISDNKLELKLKTSHGTYVKEFISGDDNKTVPSLSSILQNECACEQLDVLEICE